MGIVTEVSEDMTGDVVMVRGGEGLVTEGEVDVMEVSGGERAVSSAFQENKNQAKYNITMLVPTSFSLRQ